MRSLFFILCFFLCEFCYSQEKQNVFLLPSKDILYEPSILNNTLEQVFSFDSKNTTFKVYREEKGWVDDNAKILRMNQYLGEYRIIGGNLIVCIKDNKITRINGKYHSSVESINKGMPLAETEIMAIAEKEVFASKTDYDFQYEIEKVISKNYFDEDDKNLYYAYKIAVTDKNDISVGEEIIIDENSGKILRKTSLIRHANGTADTRYNGTCSIETTFVPSLDPSRSKYVLKDLTRGNGLFTRNLNHGNVINNYTEFGDSDNNWTASEFHNSNKDDGALDAHWAAMKTYDYFYNKHQRNSYDGAGAPIYLYIHDEDTLENASWHPTSHIFTFGDGHTNYDIFTSLDVVAHEFGHAICDYTAQLEYSGESGAICEGLSDIWGACVEDCYGTNKQTWLCGEDINLRPGHSALRSMSNPNAEGLPDTYGGLYWETGSDDNGGVHTNCGVLDYWFYLLSKGGSGTNDLGNAYEVIGIGIDNAAKIVYLAEKEYMEAETDYADMRECTINAATALFPNYSVYAKSVANAWYAVGIGTCSQYVLANQTINSDRNINECSVEVYNTTVNSGSSLNIQFQNKVILNHDLQINIGATLDIE